MEWQDMASLLCKVTAGRGTLQPRGSQECAHTNKIHISVMSLHGYLLWPKFSCSPVSFLPWLSSLALFSQSPVSGWFCSPSTNQPHPAGMWGALSPSCCWPWLAKLACTPQGQTPHHGVNTPQGTTWRGRRVPAAAGLCPQELGERDLLQGRELSSVCWGFWLL